MVEIRHDWDESDYRQLPTQGFEEYLKACYGDRELPPTQLYEVRQAFFSGIHWLNTFDDYDPDELTKALRALLTPHFPG